MQNKYLFLLFFCALLFFSCEPILFDGPQTEEEEVEELGEISLEEAVTWDFEFLGINEATQEPETQVRVKYKGKEVAQALAYGEEKTLRVFSKEEFAEVAEEIELHESCIMLCRFFWAGIYEYFGLFSFENKGILLFARVLVEDHVDYDGEPVDLGVEWVEIKRIRIQN